MYSGEIVSLWGKFDIELTYESNKIKTTFLKLFQFWWNIEQNSIWLQSVSDILETLKNFQADIPIDP